MERLSRAAAKEGAEFILFPEDAVTGYPSTAHAAFDVALVADGAELRRVAEISKANRVAIATGFIERRGELCHSAHFIARPRGAPIVIRKRSVDERDQRIGLTAAEGQNPDIDIAGALASMAICSDGNEAFFASCHSRGVQIILHPSGGACEKSVHRDDAQAVHVDATEVEHCQSCLEAAQRTAKRLGVAYCVANPIGFDGERGYPGNSFIIAPSGDVLVHLKPTAIIEQMTESFGIGKITRP